MGASMTSLPVVQFIAARIFLQPVGEDGGMLDGFSDCESAVGAGTDTDRSGGVSDSWGCRREPELQWTSNWAVMMMTKYLRKACMGNSARRNGLVCAFGSPTWLFQVRSSLHSSKSWLNQFN